MIRLTFYIFIFLIYWNYAVIALNLYQRRDDCPPPLVTDDYHPYGINIPRVNPEYCVGFEITHPVESGLVYESGSMQKIAWKVDNTKLDKLPTSIYRIRVLDDHQRNEFILGENMTIFSKDNYSGEATFPLDVFGEETEHHYRVMVVYPDQLVHCVFESVSFVIKPSTLSRYTGIGLESPSFAVPQFVA